MRSLGTFSYTCRKLHRHKLTHKETEAAGRQAGRQPTDVLQRRSRHLQLLSVGARAYVCVFTLHWSATDDEYVYCRRPARWAPRPLRIACQRHVGLQVRNSTQVVHLARLGLPAYATVRRRAVVVVFCRQTSDGDVLGLDAVLTAAWRS